MYELMSLILAPDLVLSRVACSWCGAQRRRSDAVWHFAQTSTVQRRTFTLWTLGCILATTDPRKSIITFAHLQNIKSRKLSSRPTDIVAIWIYCIVENIFSNAINNNYCKINISALYSLVKCNSTDTVKYYGKVESFNQAFQQTVKKFCLRFLF